MLQIITAYVIYPVSRPFIRKSVCPVICFQPFISGFLLAVRLRFIPPFSFLLYFMPFTVKSFDVSMPRYPITSETPSFHLLYSSWEYATVCIFPQALRSSVANESAIFCAFIYACVSYGASPPETSTPAALPSIYNRHSLQCACWMQYQLSFPAGPGMTFLPA